MRKACIVAACGLVLTACTKQASRVIATSAAPLTYDSYSCPQLADEAQHISSRAAQTTGAQDQNAPNDKLTTAAGLIIFWPALPPPKGYDPSATNELALVKAQMDAIEQASAKNKCNIAFRSEPSIAPPAATINREFH
jgi:hypothetical protein